MFQNDRYITRGIERLNKTNPYLYLFLWGLLDEMEVENKDCLQVFELTARFGKKHLFQEIDHYQGDPPYELVTQIGTNYPVNEMVLVYDNGERSLMCVADEIGFDYPW